MELFYMPCEAATDIEELLIVNVSGGFSSYNVYSYFNFIIKHINVCIGLCTLTELCLGLCTLTQLCLSICTLKQLCNCLCI